MEIGNTIACIRKARKIKQYAFAKKIDVTREYMSDIERGKKIPMYPIIEKICKELKIPIPALYILASRKEDWGKERIKEYIQIKELMFSEEFFKDLRDSFTRNQKVPD